MRFVVYKNGRSFESLDMNGAYLFGADTIPLQSSQSIRLKDSEIECRRKGTDSAGLALLWPVDGFGRIMLATTRLPERKESYILNLELARARLMHITLKKEDWALFDEGNHSATLGREAQELFIQALQSISEPSQAATLADASLCKALE